MLRRRGYGLRCIQLLVLVLVVCAGGSGAQTTSFTYQGKLSDGGGPATGSYDFQFTLWDALSGGTQQPQPSPVTVTKTNVAVTGGNFTVQLDFGASGFPGADRFLQIGVRPTGGGGFTILSPRQPINSAPYAIKSQVSDGLSVGCVNCITSSQIASVNGSAVSGTIPVGSMPAGSANYVQNTTSSQPSSNFNISGNGVVGGSLGVGITAPIYRLHVVQNVANTYGGHIQTSGLATGSSFGLVVSAGTDANDVSVNARNQSGTSMFMVRGDGRVGVGTTNPAALLHVSSSNVAGTSFVLENIVGAASRQVVLSNYGSTGGGLYWPGLDSANTSSLLGPNLFVLRSTGGLAFSGSSNAEHMRLDINGNLGVGTTTPSARVDVRANSNQVGVYGSNNGSGDGVAGISVTGNGVSGISTNGYGVVGTSSSNRGVFGYGSIGVHGYSAISYGVFGETDSGRAIYGRANIGGGLAAYFDGLVALPQLQNDGATQLCRGTANLISFCSSSLRYKTNVQSFAGGLDIIELLRPIVFDWKASRVHDIGLAAEEVEKVEPLLTFRNDKGEIEGVRYNQLSAVFINAFKEQQEQIKRQEDQAIRQRAAFATQQQQIDALKKLVCRGHRRAAACR